ncbi:MAG TPA: arginase family protein [Longimicrobium sp.]|nr:arginase family protein [Longimicrobium sp.]
MKLRILSVPYDTALRGWRMGGGPLRLLESGLAAHLREAGHDVAVEEIAPESDAPPAEIRTKFEIDRALAERVRAARSAGELPVILAGNCGTSLGTLAGIGSAPGVVWFDAHGDFNTPDTSGSGFLDGMSLAAATGRCWAALAATVPGFSPVPDDRVLLVGARDIDSAEFDLLTASEVAVLPPRIVDAGLPAALDELRTRASEVYVHIDLDVLDPSEARPNPFPAPDGLTIAQLTDALREIASRFRIAAIALTAYDPTCDENGRIPTIIPHLLAAILRS